MMRACSKPLQDLDGIVITKAIISQYSVNAWVLVVVVTSNNYLYLIKP